MCLNRIKSFINNKQAAVPVEWALICLLIAIVCIPILTDLGVVLKNSVTCSVKVFVPEFVAPVAC